MVTVSAVSLNTAIYEPNPNPSTGGRARGGLSRGMRSVCISGVPGGAKLPISADGGRGVAACNGPRPPGVRPHELLLAVT